MVRSNKGRMRFYTPVCSLFLAPILVVSPVLAQAPAVVVSAPSEIIVAPALQIQLLDASNRPVAALPRLASGLSVAVTDAVGAAVNDAVVAFRLPDSGPTGLFPDGSHAAVAYTDQSGHAHVDGLSWVGQSGTVAIRITAVKGTAHAGILVQQEVAPEGSASFSAPATPTLEPANLPVATAALTLPALPAVLPSEPPPSVQISTLHPAELAPRALASPEPGIAEQPSVSVTNNTNTSVHSGGSKAKWYILAAVAAGAGVGAMMAMKGKSSSSSSSTSSAVSIGSPTVSIGH